MTPSRVIVLFNAAAGTRPVDAKQLQRELGGDSAVQVRPIAAAALRTEAASLVGAGAPVLGVAGGDGSMSGVAAVLAGTRTALLPIPTGTLNHFARRCGIETVHDARRALEAGRQRRLPIGIAGDVSFLNTLTLGEYARAVRIREQLRPRAGKWPAALIALIRTVLMARQINVSLIVDGRDITRRTPLVWIGIGWGSFPRVDAALERRSAPDLEIAVVRAISRSATFAFLLRLGWNVMRGRQPVRDRAIDVIHARSITVDSARLMDVTADGEVLRLDPPVRVRIHDKALHVLIPPAADGSPDREHATSQT